MKRRNALRRL